MSKTTTKITDAVHADYDKLIEGLFRSLPRGGGRAAALAALCYQGWLSAQVDRKTEFEKKHDAVDPWEADVCRMIADLLMVKSDNNALTEEQIRSFYEH